MVTLCHLQDSFLVLLSKGFICRKGSGSFPFRSLTNKQPTCQQNHRRWTKTWKNCQQKRQHNKIPWFCYGNLSTKISTKKPFFPFVQRLVSEGWLPSWCCRPLFSNWAGTMWRHHRGWVVDERFVRDHQIIHLGGIKQSTCMVILRDFPEIVHCLGW